jgi:putative endonuclease
MAEFFYTYVLKSKKDGKLYTGWTKDLVRRVKEHNKGIAISTRSRESLELVYYEACLMERDAIKREKQRKTGFGRAYLKRRMF